jgi:hypothetical protein
MAEEDEAIEAINLVQDGLITGDIRAAREALDTIDLKNLSPEDAEQLLVYFISKVSEKSTGNNIGINFLVQYWRMRAEPPPLSAGSNTAILTRMFYRNDMSERMYRIVFDSVGDFTPSDVVKDILLNYDDSTVYVTLKNLDPFVIDSFVQNDMIELRENAEKENHTYMYEWLTEKIRELAPFASPPQHLVNPMGNQSYIPTVEEVEIKIKVTRGESKILSPDEAVDLITQEFYRSGYTPQDQESFREEITNKYSKADDSLKKQLVEGVTNNESNFLLNQDVIRLDQAYGPTNVMFMTDIGQDTLCNSMGGCRMLTCNCFNESGDEDDLEYGGETVDWFIGNCFQCDLKISKKWYALRIPQPHGGWQGCYCSWNCINKSIVECSGDNALIEKYERKIAEIGIQDRIENEN